MEETGDSGLGEAGGGCTGDVSTAGRPPPGQQQKVYLQARHMYLHGCLSLFRTTI